MHREMVRQLMKKAVPNEIAERYEIAWTSAMRNSNQPIPCPLCFAKGALSRLKPLTDELGISSARCENCKSKFEWPNPE